MFRILFSPIRWILKILIFVLFVGLGLLYAALFFADTLVEREIRKRTDFPVQIGSLEVSLLRTRIHLLDMEVRSPTNYPAADFLKIARFSADMKPLSLFRDRREYNEVTLHLEELTLVEGENGKINFFDFIEKMRSVPSPLLPASRDGGGPQGSKDTDARFHIDRLHIRFDRVRTVRTGLLGGESHTIAVNFDRNFNDIDDLQVLLRELSPALGDVNAQAVIYLLGESLFEVESLLGRARTLGDHVREKGEYLWELGGEATITFKNFIEEQRK